MRYSKVKSFDVFQWTVCAVLLLTLSIGCHKSEEGAEVHHGELRTIQMPEMTQDIQLPTKLWDMVTEASFEKAIQQSATFIFAPLVVNLEEKTPGVLTDSVIRLEFPKGGGQIDLSKYVRKERGTFKVRFDFEGFSDAESLKVYYISKARKRKIDDELFGSGCKHFFDVKDYIMKANGKDGLVVNVTRDRHDSALGGHFLFSYKKFFPIAFLELL